MSMDVYGLSVRATMSKWPGVGAVFGICGWAIGLRGTCIACMAGWAIHCLRATICNNESGIILFQILESERLGESQFLKGTRVPFFWCSVIHMFPCRGMGSCTDGCQLARWCTRLQEQQLTTLHAEIQTFTMLMHVLINGVRFKENLVPWSMEMINLLPKLLKTYAELLWYGTWCALVFL